jgi:hypothetical protein
MFPIFSVPPLDDELPDDEDVPPDDEEVPPDDELLEDELPQPATNTLTTKTLSSALKVDLITLSLTRDCQAAA